jgi:hypothetical protein
MKTEMFWRTLEKKYKLDALAFGQCINAREQGLNQDPFALKNRTLEFANAIASQFDSARLKAVALWLLQHAGIGEGKKVFEVGWATASCSAFWRRLTPRANTPTAPCVWRPATRLSFRLQARNAASQGRFFGTCYVPILWRLLIAFASFLTASLERSTPRYAPSTRQG